MTILTGKQVREYNPFKLTNEQEREAVISLASAQKEEEEKEYDEDHPTEEDLVNLSEAWKE